MWINRGLQVSAQQRLQSGARFPLRRALVLSGILAALVACEQQPADEGRPESARDFPRPDRSVAAAGAISMSNEAARDDRGEATVVMNLAAISPGMTVADIGAGEGYYTIRLADRVGEEGRVLAQDIDPGVLRSLGDRVERERLDNVSIKLGKVDDPGLPSNSFDRVFLIHVYRELTEPYAFLWRLRPALRPGGQVVVVDFDSRSDQHGIAPGLLFCEMDHVGFRLVEFVRKPELAGYYAQFEAVGQRPKPDQIKPCVLPDARTNEISDSG